jgi:hypothetical protein
MTAAAGFCSCNLQEQRIGFFFREAEHEIGWETLDVAAYGKVQVASGHLVDLGQIGIDHDLVAADEVDFLLDQFRRCGQTPGGCGD